MSVVIDLMDVIYYLGIELPDHGRGIDKGYTFEGHYVIKKQRHDYEIRVNDDGVVTVEVHMPQFCSKNQVICLLKEKESTLGGLWISFCC